MDEQVTGNFRLPFFMMNQNFRALRAQVDLLADKKQANDDEETKNCFEAISGKVGFDCLLLSEDIDDRKQTSWAWQSCG